MSLGSYNVGSREMKNMSISKSRLPDHTCTPVLFSFLFLLLSVPLSHAPKLEAKGGGGEEQPHVQGAVASGAQEGLEELSRIEGQEGQR